MPLAQVFIGSPGRHAAYPQLGSDVARATDSFALISGQMNGKGRAFSFNHALGKAANRVQPFLRDIREP
jgi:hypothetical protein